VRNYSLHRMPPPRFKDVIEKPAMVANQSGFSLKLDEALTTALADAAAENQGEFSDALPILALALLRLVKKLRAPDGTIMVDPNNARRLVSDAVANATKEALDAVGADEAMLRRLIIPRLVVWDPRAGEAGAAKRRMSSGSELFAGGRANLKSLAHALVDQRLLTRAGHNYEVSHESLLRVAPLGDLIRDLRSKFLRADMLTMEARDWTEKGRRIEWAGRTGERLHEAQALLDDEDFSAMLSAPDLAVQEYLTACDEKDRQEREFRERYALLAQPIGESLRFPPQTHGIEMQISEVTTPRGDRPTVYLSYSREDLEVADRIGEDLERAGFNVIIDRWSIAAGEDWKRRIETLISAADKFVILLSPARLASALGTWELDLAHSFRKQIVPVIVRVLDAAPVPSSIAGLNFIVMTDANNYGNRIQNLILALSTDIDWIREHTRYLQRATEWDAGGRSANRLLSGPDIEIAKVWVARRASNAPAPTELQLDFIKTSEAEELRQRSAEAQRLKEVAEAQDERARALAEREGAQARVARRTRVGLAAALMLASIATAFGFYASWERNRAETAASQAYEQKSLAEKQKAVADQAKEEADRQRILAEAAARRAKTLEAAIRRLDPENAVLKGP
jgi:hypothetical protein